MGAILSPARKKFRILRGRGMKLVNRGKVRDTYLLPDKKHLLMVTTDAISIFDIVLNSLIPYKGIILNLMSHFWFKLLASVGFESHMVAAGTAIDKFLPASLRGDTDLRARAMVVKKLTMREFEMIYRNVLTGSGLKDYLATEKICGYPLPPGLQDGDLLLRRPLFTPSTKEESGHDLNIDAATVRDKYPLDAMLGLEIISFATEYAKSCGILIADTKFEFGIDENGIICLGDEVLSPDSSRFWPYTEWEKGRLKTKRSAPSSFDKQPIRNAGKELGIHLLNNTSLNDLQKAWGWKLPRQLTEATTQSYRYIFWRLTGMTVEDYAREKLGVTLPVRRKNVLLLLGSESDLSESLKQEIVTARVNYVQSGKLSDIRVVANFSCHRQTVAMMSFARGRSKVLPLADVDYIIAGAGMAAALPGMLDASLSHYGNEKPVIGLAFGQEGSEDMLAAQLSISRLPGQHVIFDEINGKVYSNADGFKQAIERIAYGEFPPPKPRAKKEINYDIVV